MKRNKLFSYILAAVMTTAAAGCTSYEIEMPENPDEPAVGREVSTSVVYQANPRMFAKSECLPALTKQLDRIAGMGCDVLWVMPVCTPGEEKAVGSPYCIRDFKGVNPKYGTMADFKAMVEAAHARGMKVVLDWIANHTSWDHSWISEHPERYEKDANGNIAQASTWTDVAQLDFSNDGTREAMIDAMTYWIKEGGVDGFRCDYADGVPHDFWQSAIAAFRAIDPDFIMLAESSKEAFYDDGFDMIYDWTFAPALSDAFKGGKSADVFSKAAETWGKVPEGKNLLRFVFNHDTASENAVDAYYGSADAIPGAYVIAAMLHGTPMIYSSMDADGVKGKQSFFDYRSLEWSADKSAEFKAINAAYKATADVRRGELATYSNSKAAVFTRSIPGHTLLVMVNTTGNEVRVKTPITLAGSDATDMIGGTEETLPSAVTLPAYGYRVYYK